MSGSPDGSFSPLELRILLVTTRVTCSLSIFASVVVGLLYLLSPILRKKTMWALIVALSCMDLATAANYVINYSANKPILCNIQALLGIYFPLVSFLVTDSIGLVIFLTVVYHRLSRELKQVINYLLILSFCIPLVFTAVIGVARVEGYSPAFGVVFCWIGADQPFYWKLIGGKLVEWTSWVFVLAIYIITINRVSLVAGGAHAKRLIFIPGVFIMLRIPSALRLLLDHTGYNHPIFWLALLQSMGDPGQGVANGICFALTKGEVRAALAAFLGRPCPCLAKCLGTSKFEAEQDEPLPMPTATSPISERLEESVYVSVNGDPDPPTFTRGLIHGRAGSYGKLPADDV